MSNFCKNCGFSVREGAKFCQSCGMALEEREERKTMALITCSECGKEVSDKASACPNCGNPMRSEVNTGGFAGKTVSVAKKQEENTLRTFYPRGNALLAAVINIIFAVLLIILRIYIQEEGSAYSDYIYLDGARISKTSLTLLTIFAVVLAIDGIYWIAFHIQLQNVYLTITTLGIHGICTDKFLGISTQYIELNWSEISSTYVKGKALMINTRSGDRRFQIENADEASSLIQTYRMSKK